MQKRCREPSTLRAHTPRCESSAFARSGSQAAGDTTPCKVIAYRCFSEALYRIGKNCQLLRFFLGNSFGIWQKIPELFFLWCVFLNVRMHTLYSSTSTSQFTACAFLHTCSFVFSRCARVIILQRTYVGLKLSQITNSIYTLHHQFISHGVVILFHTRCYSRSIIASTTRCRSRGKCSEHLERDDQSCRSTCLSTGI